VSTVTPVGLALTPNGRYLVAASGTGAVVFHVAQLEKKRSPLSSWTVGSFASTGQGAIETAVSPDGNYVFVTEEDSNEMAVFDLQSALRRDFHAADLVGMVPLGLAPVGIAIAPDGRYLYVTSEEARTGQREGTLTTVNVKTAERTPARAIVSTVPAGCSPVRVVATGSSVFVTARGSDALLEFEAKDLAAHPPSSLRRVVQVGEAPVGLALVDRDRTIVVADSDRFGVAGRGANLAVVTVATDGRLVLDGYLPSGSFPRNMAASRNGKWLLVSNYGSGQVESVDVAALP
jgi:DNA-binding beta-propeller fold protein YncE